MKHQIMYLDILEHARDRGTECWAGFQQEQKSSRRDQIVVRDS